VRARQAKCFAWRNSVSAIIVRLGINALSAPVFRDDDEFIGIIGIVGTSAEIGTPPPRALIRALHQVAGTLSAELNCRIYYEQGLVK
jgi:DNA-binding IclR family transcriptional regulator